MRARRVVGVLAALAAAWLGNGCVDRMAGPAPGLAPFALTAAQRAALAAAVRYASDGDQFQPLGDRLAVERLRAACDRLAERVARNDLHGAQVALTAARRALAAARAGGPDASGAVALEPLVLVLEYVAALAVLPPGIAPDAFAGPPPGP